MSLLYRLTLSSLKGCVGFSLSLFLGISFVLSLASAGPLCAGGHGFMISQLAAPIPVSREVRLSHAHKAFGGSYVPDVKEIPALFPPAKGPCELTLDLEGFCQEELVTVQSFLKALAGNLQVPILVLENGTSYKFNRIFHGVKAFFENTPGARVIYWHKGIMTPRAAKEGLATLAVVKTIIQLDGQRSASASPVQKAASGGVGDLAHAFSQLSLSRVREKPSPMRGTQGGASACDTEVQLDEPIAAADVETVEQLLVEADVEGALEQLEVSWEMRKGGMWPPLGLCDPSQVRAFGGHLLSLASEEECATMAGKLRGTVVLKLSGLFPGQMKGFPDLCAACPSIRCIIVSDSSCKPLDFSGLYASDYVPDDGDLLGEDKIRFIDVRTAFSGGDTIADLTAHYTEKEQEASLDYFVRFSEGCLRQSDFRDLPDAAQKTHHLYWILKRYIEHLRAYPKIVQAVLEREDV